MSSFKKMWFKKGIVWEVVFILTILYAVSSINVFLIFKSMLPLLKYAFFKSDTLRIYAGIAVVLAVFLSIYHITVMLHKPHHKHHQTGGVK